MKRTNTLCYAVTIYGTTRDTVLATRKVKAYSLEVAATRVRRNVLPTIPGALQADMHSCETGALACTINLGIVVPKEINHAER